MGFNYWSLAEVVEVVAFVLVMPEWMLSLALLVSTLALLWQAWRRPGDRNALRPVDPQKLLLYTPAWLALLAVAVPTFAAFGFCFWLGPFV